PSIVQEFRFNLLKYLSFLEQDRFNEAICHYKKEISGVCRLHISKCSLSIQEIYIYISGLYKFETGQYQDSIELFKSALEITTDKDIPQKLSYNIALAYYRLYDFCSSLVYAKKALSIYINSHNWIMAADCYNLIASILIESNKLNEAIEYIEKGFSVLQYQEINETHAKLYHNRSLIYLREQKHVEALSNINNCIKIKQNLKTSSVFTSVYTKLNIFLETGDLIRFKENLDILQRLAKSNNDIAKTKFSEAKMHYKTKEFSIYERLMKECVLTFYSNKDWRNVKLAAEHYSTYLANSRSYKSAFQYLKICTEAYKNIYREVEGGGIE
ncbi:hypothetical protein QT711_17970, partial [Sporosarcina saromensis]